MPVFSLDHTRPQRAGRASFRSSRCLLGSDHAAYRVDTYSIEDLQNLTVKKHWVDKKHFTEYWDQRLPNIEDVVKSYSPAPWRIAAETEMVVVHPDEDAPLDYHHWDVLRYTRSKRSEYYSSYTGVEYKYKVKWENTLSVIDDVFDFIDYLLYAKAVGYTNLPEQVFTYWRETLVADSLGVSTAALDAAAVQDRDLLVLALENLQEIYTTIEKRLSAKKVVNLWWKGKILKRKKIGLEYGDIQRLLKVVHGVKDLVEANLDKLAMTVVEIDEEGPVVSDMMRRPNFIYTNWKRNLPSHKTGGAAPGVRKKSIAGVIVFGGLVGLLIAQS